ncbi:MAG: RNA methyltransferase [Bacilli bacterium]
MIKITSLSNNIIKDLAKLSDKKYRQINKQFLVEGYHLINEANKINRLNTVLITKEEDYIDGVNNILVTNEIIKKITNTISPQGIVGVCDMVESSISGDRFLILDNISDPGNMGTLIRSALGFNIDTVIVSDDSVDIYNDKVIRSTQGAIFNINIVICDISKAIDELKENNVMIIGTSLKSSKYLNDINRVNKYAIILGNEASGIKEEVLNKTDFNVKIKINSKLESLNVAIAGGIIMNHFM